MIFFTADTHFGHKRVLDFRPWSTLEEMEESLVSRWNDVVGKRDVVYHLGDFAWFPRDYARILKRLSGQVRLIRGNHEPEKSDAWFRKQGFASVHDVYYLRHGDERFWLAHYAHRTWRSSHHGSFHVYGHSHGNILDYNRSMDVGVDAVGYYPICMDNVLALLRKQPSTDHHPKESAPPFSTCQENAGVAQLAEHE